MWSVVQSRTPYGRETVLFQPVHAFDPHANTRTPNSVIAERLELEEKQSLQIRRIIPICYAGKLESQVSIAEVLVNTERWQSLSGRQLELAKFEVSNFDL